MDWEFIGGELLEREWRPVLLLDPAFQVMKVNRAFLQRVPNGARVLGVDFRGEWLHPDSVAHFNQALAEMARASRSQVTVDLAILGHAVAMTLELLPLGQGAVMCVVLATASRSLPLRPVAGMTYEVTMDEARRVVRSQSSDDRPDARPADAPCWSKMFGREDRCPICPVLRLGGRDRATVVSGPEPGESGHLKVLVAEHRGGRTITVTAFPIEPETYSALIGARADVLAAESNLTPRERELLPLLMMGRSLAEIGTAVGITERTAKFHKQNVLKKLGAESRDNLLRLLL